MKLRTFVILLVLCAVLGGAAYFMSGQSNQSKDNQLKMGENLLGDLPVGDIAAITIKSQEDSVVLKEDKNIWFVENKFNYPANFSMISDIVDKVRKTKIGRYFKASDEKLSRLSLHDPDKERVSDDQKGVRITLQDKAEKILADMIIGGTREASSGTGGHYVMLVKSPTIYLVDQTYRYVDKNPSDWLDKDLLKVEEKDVEKVVCFDPKSQKALYTLKRPEKGKDPEFADMPQGKKIKKPSVSKIFRAISSLKAEDITDPSVSRDTAFENALLFEYHLFDGTVYKVYPGNALENDDTKYHFKAEVSFSPPETEEEKTDAAKPEEEGQKSHAELSVKAENLNKKISPWTYVISKWRHDNFISDTEEFFEKEEDKEPKAEVRPPEVRNEELPEVSIEKPVSDDTESVTREPGTDEPEAESDESELKKEEPEAETEDTEISNKDAEEADADTEEAESETEEDTEVKSEEAETEDEAEDEEAEANTEDEEAAEE